MDLLGGYGSDSEPPQQQEVPAPAVVAPHVAPVRLPDAAALLAGDVRGWSSAQGGYAHKSLLNSACANSNKA